MLIQQNMKMADVIHLNHHLLHIISRFGIQLGFGEKTVEAVCNMHNVPLSFFLELVNTFHDITYFPVHNLQQFKAKILIDYLKNTHQYYLDFKIPEIEHNIHKLTHNDKISVDVKYLLNDFFTQYVHELTVHINKEEQRVYPYVLALEQFIDSESIDMEILQQLKAYSIVEYEEDHDDVESKLYDLKNLIIKYFPPTVESRILNSILHDIFELETDLNNHGRIEDLILVPIVEKLEKKLEDRLSKINN